MTLPTYASTGLPDSPLVDSWAITKPFLDPTQSDMEGGNKRMRRQPGDDMMQLQFDIIYTQAQFSTFRTWVNTFRGIGRFTMYIWDGTARVSKTVQFAQTYQPQSVPPKVRVTFNLWVYPA